jgi:hypothetical protein
MWSCYFIRKGGDLGVYEFGSDGGEVDVTCNAEVLQVFLWSNSTEIRFDFRTVYLSINNCGEATAPPHRIISLALT